MPDALARARERLRPHRAAALTEAFRRSDAPALVLLAAWALVPLAYLSIRSLGDGGTLTGAEGLTPTDQLQYLAWIRDSGEHVLISNRFGLEETTHDFLHPMFLVSGALWRLGLDIQVALLVWAPVAVGVLFAGFRAYVRRTVQPDGWPRRVALVLGLFFFTPALPLLDWTGILGPGQGYRLELLTYEGFNATQLWGYLHVGLAMGLLALVLLEVERLIEPDRRAHRRGPGWYALWAAGGGLVVSWLHPWQGVILLLILAGIAAWGRFERRLLPLAVPAVGALLPLIYFFVLAQADPVWGAAREAASYPHSPPWIVAAALAPLGVLAALGARGPADTIQDRVLRLWPLAAVAVYYAVDSSPYHAFQGLSLPLAVLAVRGWRRMGHRPALAAGAVAVATLPGFVHGVYLLEKYVDGERGGYLLRDGERRALEHIERSSLPGGVLARTDMGAAVPGFAGRNTWVGHRTWSPDAVERAKEADDLFRGRLAPADAQALVARAGAAFLLSDCGANADLAPALGPAVRPVRFGCATVYEVAAPVALRP